MATPWWSRLRGWIRPRGDMVSDLRHPSAWLSSWALGTRTRAGMLMTPQAAMSLAIYYACLRNISEDVGKLPLLTYRRLQPRGKERAPRHPAYAVLHDAPNPDMTAMTFREVLTHWALAWGNGYAEIVRNRRGTRLALYPIHPSRVHLRRNEEGELVYDIYGSGAPVLQSDQPWAVRLPQRDVLHLKGLGAEGYSGYSVVHLAAESLALTQNAERFGTAFFQNGAFFSGVLTHPGRLSPEAMEHLRTSWQEQYQGPDNAGKPAILEEGLTWHPLSIPPDQAQFLESRQFQVVEIARWFRMPLHKIQDLTNAHYNNLEQQNLEYVTDTLMPWLVRFEQELKRKIFADDPEHFAEHLVLGLLRGDQATRAQYYKERFGMGTLSPNEIRALESENEIGPDGDHYFIANNNYAALDQILRSQGQSNAGEGQVPFTPVSPGRNGTSGHRILDDEADED